MILNFIFSNLNAIVLTVWVLFLLVVAIRFFQPSRSKIYTNIFLNKHISKIGVCANKICVFKTINNGFKFVWKKLHLNSFITKIGKGIKSISYKKLILIALGLNIFYGLFVSWGQYYVWSTASDITRFLLTSPLPEQTPFLSYLEWTRPLFNNDFGYFLFYILGRIWLSLFLLFTFSGLMYFVFKTWKNYRGGFQEQGPELMLVLMLISGWMGVMVSLALGFIFAILLIGFYLFKGKKIVVIESAFIFATFFALFFSKIILGYF